MSKSNVPVPKAGKAAKPGKSGKLTFSKLRDKKKLLKVLGKYCLMLWAVSVVWALGFRFVDPPATLLMLQRKNEGLQQTGKWRMLHYRAVSMRQVSKEVPLALMAAEDQNFLHHSGFDFKAMQKAFEHNRKGRTVRGGSTISQQVAKNVFLWHGRSYIRKAMEVYFTAFIELFWGKKRIMELYMSVAETGDHYFGVEAASQWAFRKKAQNLTRAEAATIAAVLPNPRRFSARNPSAYIAGRRNRIVGHMRSIGGTALVSHFY